MLDILLLDTIHKRETNVTGLFKEAYEKRALPIRSIAAYGDVSLLIRQVGEEAARFNVFVAAVAVLNNEMIGFINSLRRLGTDIRIIFISDSGAEVASSIRAQFIGASSDFMVVPTDRRRLYEAIVESYVYFTGLVQTDSPSLFKVKSDGEYFAIHTADILYFESRGKKIAVVANDRELLFYSNFNELMEQLPDWFVRCHRGYVVNVRRIKQVCFPDMIILMKDRRAIPISRTYQKSLKMFFNPKNNETSVRL